MNRGEARVWNEIRIVAPAPNGSAYSSIGAVVYSPVEAGVRGVNIKNYETLDAAPDLILYEGWYDKAANTAKLVDKSREDIESAVAV